MTNDVFASAPVAPAPEKKGKSKKAKPELHIGEKLDILAAASAITQSLESVILTHSEDVKGEMLKHFAQEGTALGRRPENVRGIGVHSSASLELRKRDSRTVLKEEEADMLREAGVRLGTKVIQEEKFFFNEEILKDPVLREKVSQALGLIDFGGMSPIIKQERIEASVIEENSINDAFAGKTPEEAEKLTKIVGTLAIKPVFTGSLKDAAELLVEAGVTLG